MLSFQPSDKKPTDSSDDDDDVIVVDDVADDDADDDADYDDARLSDIVQLKNHDEVCSVQYANILISYYQFYIVLANIYFYCIVMCFIFSDT